MLESHDIITHDYLTISAIDLATPARNSVFSMRLSHSRCKLDSPFHYALLIAQLYRTSASIRIVPLALKHRGCKLYVKVMSFASSSSGSCTARDYSVSSSQCSIANQSLMRKFFDNLENDGARRITEFTRYTQKCLEESEQAKPFIFPVGMYPEGENPINLQSTHGIDFYEDYDEMAMREKEISAKLKKIKAMAFVLESEQHTLRKRLSHGGTS